MNDSVACLPDGRPEKLAAYLAEKAVTALMDEAHLTPKPGLVDCRGSGSHDDMDLALLEASAKSLEPVFTAMALSGWHRLPDTALRRRIGAIGRDGEKTMMAVTGGINTHRGAIWSLGLLVTAVALHAGSCSAGQAVDSAATLARLADTASPPVFSKGQYASRRYRVPGAREEAQAGFPHITQKALPQLGESRLRGVGEEAARVDALLAIMASLSDTCILSRGGWSALVAVQQGARTVLKAGGIGTAAGKAAFYGLEENMLALRVSPGGAADLLAATLFLDGVTIR